MTRQGIYTVTNSIGSQCQFKYNINDEALTIKLVDYNEPGTVSLTNSIRQAIALIQLDQHIEPNDYLIVYRDSTGQWDGWDPRTNQFVGLGIILSGDDAIEYYQQLEMSKNLETEPGVNPDVTYGVDEGDDDHHRKYQLNLETGEFKVLYDDEDDEIPF